jgi:dipeptidyl aminopeptidase/acylaminoacyl peptidase
MGIKYGGSSGYGRQYILQEKWGIVDTEDCILAARTLAFEEKLVDPKRMVIRGGSAGGYAILAILSILSNNNVFNAISTSSYGI